MSEAVVFFSGAERDGIGYVFAVTRPNQPAGMLGGTYHKVSTTRIPAPTTQTLVFVGSIDTYRNVECEVVKLMLTNRTSRHKND
jgi:hypothetical protein